MSHYRHPILGVLRVVAENSSAALLEDVFGYRYSMPFEDVRLLPPDQNLFGIRRGDLVNFLGEVHDVWDFRGDYLQTRRSDGRMCFCLADACIKVTIQ